MDNGYTFTDRKGRTWDATLTLAGASRIDASDFSAVTSRRFSILRPDKGFFTEVATDPVLIASMLWAIVQPQVASNLKLTAGSSEAEAEFLDGFDGPAFESAKGAFWRALSDFFPQYKTVLQTLLGQLAKAQTRIADEISKMGADIDKVMEKGITESFSRIREELGNTGEK